MLWTLHPWGTCRRPPVGSWRVSWASPRNGAGRGVASGSSPSRAWASRAWRAFRASFDGGRHQISGLLQAAGITIAFAAVNMRGRRRQDEEDDHFRRRGGDARPVAETVEIPATRTGGAHRDGTTGIATGIAGLGQTGAGVPPYDRLTGMLPPQAAPILVRGAFRRGSVIRTPHASVGAVSRPVAPPLGDGLRLRAGRRGGAGTGRRVAAGQEACLIYGPGSFGAPALPLARHGGNPEPVGTTAQGVLGVNAHLRGTPRRIWSWSSKSVMS
jgi:hypothetical protein